MSKTSPLAPLQSGEGKNRNAEINTIFFQRGEVTAKNEPLPLGRMPVEATYTKTLKAFPGRALTNPANSRFKSKAFT